MSEIEIIVASDIKTKGDAARGAASLGQELVNKWGIDKSQASEVAAHEYLHARADRPHLGILGIVIDMTFRCVGSVFYRSVGTRSAEQVIKVALAVGDKMSQQDRELVNQAEEKIRDR